MARRVGFGDDSPPKKKATPRSKPLSKPRPTLASLARLRRERKSPGVEAPKTPLLGRLFVGGFLLIWLTGWSAGIIFAIGAFLGEFGEFRGGGDLFARGFLFVWISFALIGWWFAARALLRIIRGEPIQTGKSKS